MKTHWQEVSIPVSRNSPAKVLRSQPDIIQAFWQMTTLFFAGEEMGGMVSPKRPRGLGLTFIVVIQEIHQFIGFQHLLKMHYLIK